jgi:hypothetical protein
MPSSVRRTSTIWRPASTLTSRPRSFRLWRRLCSLTGMCTADPDNIDTMDITNGTVSADVEYTNHEDGTWSFRLTFEDDPVRVESVGSFPTKALAEEQVNYELQAAALRIAEG